MTNYAYVAVDPRGMEMRGVLEVADQSEALRRLKQMGLFPTKVAPATRPKRQPGPHKSITPSLHRSSLSLPCIRRKVRPAVLAVFTRQLATLIEAGMPLLRSLRTLHQQEENRRLKIILAELSSSIENGCSLTEAVAEHPKTFNRLYINMVKAGETAGALPTTLGRLAEFMEKGQKIKGKVKAAMFYPCAVLLVAVAILTILMVYVVPRFSQVFEGLLNGTPLPAFTRFVFSISAAVTHHLPLVAAVAVSQIILFMLAVRTTCGRAAFDRFKLSVPILGPLFRKSAISRFSRTLGTLVSNGVPILQALTIVEETAGNRVIGALIGTVHERVKQGDPIAPILKCSNVFPAMVAGMIDVGEQTGALPEMLMKVADNYDDQVDNAANAITSLLEPIMIVFLAVVVGSIVIAMFLPLIIIIQNGFDGQNPADQI